MLKSYGQTQAESVVTNLVSLSKDYKTSDPVQSTFFRRSFKDESKNNLVRSVVYLLEVVGSRDAQFKAIQEENKDLRELLKLNNISLDEAPAEGNPQNVSAEDLAAKADAQVTLSV